MPEPNVRFAVLGAPRADKEYDAFARERRESLKVLAQLERQLAELNGRVRRNAQRRR